METQAEYTARGPDRRQGERRIDWPEVDELAATWADPANSDPEMAAVFAGADRPPIGRGGPFTPAEVAAARRAVGMAQEMAEESPRVGSIDRIVDAMEAAMRAAEDVMHPVCIHIAPESWVAVRSMRDLEQVPGDVDWIAGSAKKYYRGVTFFATEY